MEVSRMTHLFSWRHLLSDATRRPQELSQILLLHEPHADPDHAGPASTCLALPRDWEAAGWRVSMVSASQVLCVVIVLCCVDCIVCAWLFACMHVYASCMHSVYGGQKGW